MRHQLGRVVTHSGFKRVKAIGVGCDVGRVRPAFPQHDVQHAVEQHHVGARLDRQVQVGNARSVGLAWVAEDDFERWIFLFHILNSAKQNRVRVRGVGANNENARCRLDIVIAGGWRISPQRLLVARHCAAHAQAGVGVDVVSANQALGEFVEDVIVLGE